MRAILLNSTCWGAILPATYGTAQAVSDAVEAQRLTKAMLAQWGISW